jgi:hypothetical protein
MLVLLSRGCGSAAELVAAVLAVPVAVAHGPYRDAGAGELAHVLARAAPHLVPAHLGLLILALCTCVKISVLRGSMSDMNRQKMDVGEVHVHSKLGMEGGRGGGEGWVGSWLNEKVNNV